MNFNKMWIKWFLGQIFVPPKMTQKMTDISPAQFRGGGGQVTVVNNQRNQAAVEKRVKIMTWSCFAAEKS